MSNEEREDRTRLALKSITKFAEDLNAAKESYTFRKNVRDFAIIQAINSGISMYAIAKHAGISQSAVAQIRDNYKEKK